MKPTPWIWVTSAALIACTGSAPAPSASAAAAAAATSEKGDEAERSGRGEAVQLAPAAPPCPGLEPLATRFPAPPRIVAIGDLHGDMRATRAVLELAGAIDAAGRWVGGNLVVVQTGDVLDRGDDEQAILDLLERLAAEAAAAGGAVHVLNGNHELMNAAGDLRYVTPGGFADFEDVAGLDAGAPAVAATAEDRRARVAAFMPGGMYARVLARHNVAVVIGDWVFAHGGILPEHVTYGLERLNHEVRCWLQGHAPAPAMLDDRDNPVWTRRYSFPPEDCDALETTLAALGVSRMAVGHTPQMRGINAACDSRVWRIDVGMAAHYGGPTQALEIRGDTVRVLAP